MTKAKASVSTVERAVGKIAGLLARNLPLPRGRDRLALMASSYGAAPTNIDVVRTRGGRLLHIDPDVFFYRHAYFTGVYEPGIARLIGILLRPGQICADVGANIGWHTIAMADHVGPHGKVHAFEPFPASFALLARNVSVNQLETRIQANQAAVSNHDGTVAIHVAPGEPATHATIAVDGSAGVEVATVALDRYDDGALVGAVDLMKIDVEGAEDLVIRSADAILRSKNPPSLIIEAAVGTSKPFGYGPNDLLDRLDGMNAFRHFIIDERTGRLVEFKRFEQGHPGANILCAPRSRPEIFETLRQRKLLRPSHTL